MLKYGELSGIVNDKAESDFIYTMTSKCHHININDHFLLTLYLRAYHDYAQSMGTTFTKPDLAIAFNSGCSQESVSLWKETIFFLMQNKIPSIFTVSYFVNEIYLCFWKTSQYIYFQNQTINFSLTLVKRLKRMRQSSRALV